MRGRMLRRALVFSVISIVGCGGSNTPRVAMTAPTQAPSPVASTAQLASTPRARCESARPSKRQTPIGGSHQGGAVALAKVGSTTLAYVADEDDGAIHTFDVDARRELSVTPTFGSVAQVLVLDDGRVAATLRDQNQVAIYDVADDAGAPLEKLCSQTIATEPIGLGLTNDGATLLVTSGWGKRLSALSTEALDERFSVSIPREPRAIVVSDDARRAFVSHAVGAQVSVIELEGQHEVRTIDVRAQARGNGGIFGPREGAQGYVLAKLAVKGGASSSASRLFAPMTSVDPGPAKISAGYGPSADRIPPEAAFVAVIDPRAERAMASRIEPDGSQSFASSGPFGECILPRAVATDEANASLFVSCLGIDSVVQLDVRAADPTRAIRKRWKVEPGPMGVAFDGARLVVWSQFARALSIITPADDSTATVAAAHRDGSPWTAEMLRGRALFHKAFDARISTDGRACASCHPDGRDDGLTWSTPDGPRQTIWLAGRVTATAPYGWFGAHGDLREHLVSTFHRLGGEGMFDEKNKEDLDALTTYVGAMRGPSIAVRDAEVVKQGKALFDDAKVGCAGCHATGGTDRLTHDIGSGRWTEKSLKFDTPSLRFVGGSAPYYHDGRYPTLDALLFSTGDTMGHTLTLSRDERVALIAYLESL
jgi:hypothetical protein